MTESSPSPVHCSPFSVSSSVFPTTFRVLLCPLVTFRLYQEQPGLSQSVTGGFESALSPPSGDPLVIQDFPCVSALLSPCARLTTLPLCRPTAGGQSGDGVFCPAHPTRGLREPGGGPLCLGCSSDLLVLYFSISCVDSAGCQEKGPSLGIAMKTNLMEPQG